MGQGSSGRLLPQVLDTVQVFLDTTIPDTATTAATSTDLGGLTCQWTQPNAPVIVTCTGTIQINNTSAAANTRINTIVYIADATDTTNHVSIGTASNAIRTTIFYVAGGTLSGIIDIVPFVCKTVITATPGSTVSVEARAFVGTGAASTWTRFIRSTPLGYMPLTMTAEVAI